MNKFILICCLFIVSATLFTKVLAQVKDPVKWKYEAKKNANGKLELVVTATVEKPWHLYSQNTGDGPIPTKFVFKTNPLITLEGTTKESGKLEKSFDKNFNSTVLFYQGSVVFTQAVKVKNNIKTNITGTVEYMVCNDEQCLPPTKKTFDIKL